MTDKPDTAAIRAQMDALRGFTPGPWMAEHDDCHYGTLSSIRGGEAGKKSGLHRALMVEVGGWQGVKAQEATTRLIAAAPEMHATILTLCDALDAERAENDRLRAALSDSLRYYPSSVVECRGDKCRELWCASCYGWDEAEEFMVKVEADRSAIRAALDKRGKRDAR